CFFFFFQAEDGIRDFHVTGVQTCALPILQVAGGPVTTAGTLAISYATGYAIPTTAKQGQWDTAYGWGNHTAAGYALASSLGTARSEERRVGQERRARRGQWHEEKETESAK